MQEDLGPDPDELGGQDPDDGDLQGPLPLRKAYKDLRKRVPEMTSAAEQRGLEKGRAEARRQLLAEQQAATLGFANTFGETFLRANPDTEPTEEALRSFAESLGVRVGESQKQTPGEGQADAEEAKPDPNAEAAKNFAPNGSQTPATGKVYTAAEWLTMYQDPAQRNEAEAAAKEGRVSTKHAVAGSGGFGRNFTTR